jgi:hypothetical protein
MNKNTTASVSFYLLESLTPLFSLDEFLEEQKLRTKLVKDNFSRIMYSSKNTKILKRIGY